MNLEVKIISDFKNLQAIEEDWESILADNGYPSIALTPQWLTTWLKSHMKYQRFKLFVLVCFEQKKPIAIFPFYLCKAKYRGIPIKKLSFMVDGISPHADFIIESKKMEEAIHALLNYLAFHIEQWDVIIFDKFRDTPNRRFLLESINLYHMNYGVQPSLVTPIIMVDRTWDIFWSQLSTKFKKSMRNKLNRTKITNSISIEKVEHPEELEGALDSIFRVSKQSWKGKIRRALTDNPVEHSFYINFTMLGARKGWIRIWLLKYQGNPIAYEYHIVYNKTVYPLRADFDEDYRHLSPGSILEYYIIKDLFENNGCHTYYSCANDYQYLRNWTDNFERLYRIDIFNSKAISDLLFSYEYKILPELRKIKILRKIKDSIVPFIRHD